MYARNVTFRIGPNMQPDYTHAFENQILPLLRKQKGFKEEITLCNPSSPEAVQSACGSTRAMLTNTILASIRKC